MGILGNENGQSIKDATSHDDQAEKEWQDCKDDELPRKRGYKNRKEYNPETDFIHQLLKHITEKFNGKK
tara:strand:+ start:44 stop:250 length:207 start_codon:yes stop_codon:yes gene_type:complete